MINHMTHKITRHKLMYKVYFFYRSPVNSMRPFSAGEAKFIDRVVLAVLVASGLAHQSPRNFYRMFAFTFLIAMGAHIVSALVCQFLFKSFGTLIQQGKAAQKENVRQELLDTVLGFGSWLPLLPPGLSPMARLGWRLEYGQRWTSAFPCQGLSSGQGG